MAQANAVTAITNAGLSVGSITESFDTAVIGTVLIQNPAAGVLCASGQKVHLTLSKGVEVPNVVGLSLSAASTALGDAGFIPGTPLAQSSTTVAAGLIGTQSVAGGEGANPGSTIFITLSIGNVYLVDKASAAEEVDQDGLTWNTAFNELQEAITAAQPGSADVWVAGGVYDEARADVDGSLALQSGVDVYGGFQKHYASFEMRNWESNLTVIHGATARSGGVAAYHVVKGADNATLDGFTITGGNASGVFDSPQGSAGGMFIDTTSPDVANCTFYNNRASSGGAISIRLGAPTLTNCRFLNNQSDKNGAGIKIYGSSVI